MNEYKMNYTLTLPYKSSNKITLLDELKRIKTISTPKIKKNWKKKKNKIPNSIDKLMILLSMSSNLIKTPFLHKLYKIAQN